MKIDPHSAVKNPPVSGVRRLGLPAVLLCWFASALSALAASNYSQNFDANSTGWSVVSGDWARTLISGTNYSFDVTTTPAPASPLALYNDDTWTSDFTYEVKIMPWGTGSGNKCGLRFNYVDASNYYELLLSSTGPATLEKTIAGTTTASATGTWTFTAGAFNTVKIIRAGSLTTVQINGTNLFTDVTQSGLGAGKLGLSGRNSKPKFDNIIVTLTTTPPSGQFVYFNLFCMGGNADDVINIPMSDFARYHNILFRKPTYYHWGGLVRTSGNTLWEEVRRLNPECRPWIYTHGAAAVASQSTVHYSFRSTMGRVFAESSGDGGADSPALGAADGSPSNAGSDSFGTYSNRDYILRTSSGTPITSNTSAINPDNVFEFGQPGFARFFAEAHRQDLRVKGSGVVGRGAWGIHTDTTKSSGASEMPELSGTPALASYALNINNWTDRIIEYYKNTAKRLSVSGIGYKLQASTGFRLPEQQKCWRALNSAPVAERPGQIISEKMFVIDTPTQVRFVVEGEWESGIQMLAEINNVEVASSNAQRVPAGWLDQYGAAVNIERAIRYSLCSFLLVKRDSPRWYYGILWLDPDQTATYWQPELRALNGGRMMDLGAPVNPGNPGTGVMGLRTTTINGVKLYVREYTRGAVIVHARLGTSPGNSATIDFTALFGRQARVITRANIGSTGDGTTLPALQNTFTLAPLNGVFLRW
jgi:hypothetical protein